MKAALKYFPKLLLFFMVLFFSHRIIFLLFQTGSLKLISTKEIFLVFTHAFAMDVAAGFAMLIIPFLLISVHLFLRKNIAPQLLRYFINFIIVITSFVNVCDIALYQQWGTRINTKAISFLAFPKEAASNAWSVQFIFPVLIFLLQAFLFIRLYKKYFRDEILIDTKIIYKIIFILLMPGVLITGVRGGFQKYPLDRTWAYFSRHSVLNQAAVNSSWNFFHALTDPVDVKKNSYLFFSDADAKKYFEEEHKSASDSSVQILKTNRPDIVLIMLESFSAEVMEPLGGQKNMTPNLKKLSKEGLLFNNFYTPGFRTEQGLAALVSGFPSQPLTSIIRQFGKFEKLPSIARTLDSAGYTSSYYYGGNLHFAYTGSYLLAEGFDKVIGENDFSFKRRTDWGAYDDELFRFFNEDMAKSKEPFFSIIMTSTNHEPFNADVEKINRGNPGDWCNDYFNTVHYTDKSLGELFEGMKKQSWYDHTLVAIVADHAHTCPEKFEYNSAARHRIPFLLLGGALKEEYKGKLFEKISSQVDFPATILSLLNLKHDHFHWSKNIFNPASPAFAFYSFDDGFGWINQQQQLVYDHKLKQVISIKNNGLSATENEHYLNYGKAYLQLLMDEYIRFNEK